MVPRHCLGVACGLLMALQLAWCQERPTPIDGRTFVARAGGQAISVERPGVEDVLRVAAPRADGDRLAGEDCPQEGFLCGQDEGGCSGSQWYFYSDMEFCNPSAPTQCQRVRVENFPPPGVTISAPIGVIVWKGVYVDDQSNGCAKTGDWFRIRFYLDDAGAPAANDPNDFYYEEIVEAIAHDAGRTVLFNGATIPAILWEFTIELTTPVPLTTGWFSLVGQGAPHCYHLWQGSNEGNSQFYQWWEENGTIPGAPQATLCDLEYCFGQKLIGACCHDCDTPGLNCEDDVAQQRCLASGGFFALGQTCAQLSPPCGDGVGACCRDDGSCVLTKCADCGSPCPNTWLGRNTTCSDCCTVVHTAPVENEPPMGSSYFDTYNAGCDRWCLGDANCDGVIDFDDINPFVLALSDPVQYHAEYPSCNILWCDINLDCSIDFVDINPFIDVISFASGPCDFATIPLPAGNAVYGKSGTFSRSCVPSHDTDWYRYTTAVPSSFTLQADAEFDFEAFIIHAGSCVAGAPDPYWYVYRGEAERCANPEADLAATTHVLPAGEYWFVVQPQALSGVPVCADYQLSVTPQAGDACHIEPAGCTHPEGEPCGHDTNGGCNAAPTPVFEDLGVLTIDPNDPNLPVAVICGTAWADWPERDTDWYKWKSQVTAQITWRVTTEIPVRVTTVSGPDFSEASCDALWGYWGLPAIPACSSDPNVTTFTTPDWYSANREYWLVVLPEHPEWGALFFGYPCWLDQGQYRIDLSIIRPICSGLCAGSTPDGETNDCDPNDAYNGGCDRTVFGNGPFVTDPISFGTAYCGESGTFDDDRDYDWWKVAITSTNRARLKVTLRSEFNLVWELYSLIGTDCDTRVLQDYYKLLMCESTATIYSPCLDPGTYYMRVYSEIPVPCAGPPEHPDWYRTYRLTVALDQQGCTPCELTCTISPDDPCQNDPNDPEFNDPCNDPNHPGPPMVWAVGNYPTYGARQCGHISTFVDSGGGLWVDRDFLQFTMPAGKTKLYVRAKAEFRFVLRMFDTLCQPILDAGGLQKQVGYDRACALSSVQSISALTAGATYWAEIVYGNGLTGTNLREWFEGLPCSRDSDLYELELAGGV